MSVARDAGGTLTTALEGRCRGSARNACAMRRGRNPARPQQSNFPPVSVGVHQPAASALASGSHTPLLSPLVLSPTPPRAQPRLAAGDRRPSLLLRARVTRGAFGFFFSGKASNTTAPTAPPRDRTHPTTRSTNNRNDTPTAQTPPIDAKLPTDHEGQGTSRSVGSIHRGRAGRGAARGHTLHSFRRGTRRRAVGSYPNPRC